MLFKENVLMALKAEMELTSDELALHGLDVACQIIEAMKEVE